MKRLTYSIAMILSLTFFSCSKIETNVEPASETKLETKTFSVSMPETKTTLNGKQILWSDDDKITIIEMTNKVTRTFTISSGWGTKVATFTGEVTAGEASFFAVYPNVAIKMSDLSSTKIPLNAALPSPQNAVKDGYDPRSAVMTGIPDASGAIDFRHGMAYFKLTLGNEDVKSVKLSTDKDARLAGRPEYNPETGKCSAVQSASNSVELSGTLEKDAVYYIPVLVKPNKTLQTLTIRYTFNNDTYRELSTTAYSSIVMKEGEIYNLGKPVMTVTPEFSASNLTIEAGDEGGTINFTVQNTVTGGYVVSTVPTDGLSNASWGAVSYDSATGAGSITFTCDANTSTESPKTATVHLVYTTNGTDELATADITVTQKKKASGSSTTYSWSFASSDVMSSAWSGSGDYTWNSNTTGQTISYSYSKDQIVEYPSGSGIYCMKTTGDAKPGNSSGKRVFTYAAPCAGTLTIKGYKQSTNDGALTVTLDGEAVTKDTGSSSEFSSNSDVSTCVYTISKAGTVVFYTAKKSYFQSVDFTF